MSLAAGCRIGRMLIEKIECRLVKVARDCDCRLR
ncbi:hypothetical protein Pan189_08550 [Stratiformator vulcanicus]|uniref:Uncharacterized protein n=1 Tax=Stratiformator vulcanicus TaxID=2527980 RepID=A0A517QY31_9PLAN|nr:hypothetical protein Pan189_08550 [Stratiformator vulcanicus]